MSITLEAKSTLTDRYQTTVPEVVRQVLCLDTRDKIHYTIRPNGEVVLSRVETESLEEDEVLTAFLDFLAREMAAHPERLRALDSRFVQHLGSLTEGVEIDLDEAYERMLRGDVTRTGSSSTARRWLPDVLRRKKPRKVSLPGPSSRSNTNACFNRASFLRDAGSIPARHRESLPRCAQTAPTTCHRA
ncbi:type II toxin-antitoxin system PrlF family antitoxin [Paracidovorax citrulli]